MNRMIGRGDRQTCSADDARSLHGRVCIVWIGQGRSADASITDAPNRRSTSSSMVSTLSNRPLVIVRMLRRVPLIPCALPLVFFAALKSESLPNGSPGLPPNQRNGPSSRVSGSKNIQTTQPLGFFSSAVLILTWRVLASS